MRRTQRNNGAVLGALRWASGAEKGETVKRSLAWLNGMVERGEVVEAQHCHTVGILMLEEEDFEGGEGKREGDFHAVD